jgi:LacI family transcriptional regulator
MRKSEKPQVVILTSTITQCVRAILAGVLQYAQERGHWRIDLRETHPQTHPLRSLNVSGCAGIVAADHHSVREARLIANAGVPVIVLLQPHPMRQPAYPLFPYPCVLWNSAAVGRMAARYFIERHYAHYAFVGDTHAETYWSQEREQGFREVLNAAGQTSCHSYAACSVHEQRDWAVERPRMEAWLRALPKPIALFAVNDRRGKQVLDACLNAGVVVPDEVAVLAVDNDEWICEATVPTLSSIQCNPQPTGYRIAGHLDRLMRGERLPKREYLVEPAHVVTRQSTDWTALTDPSVVKALAFIRTNAAQAEIGVGDIARAMGLSRRALEVRFRTETGHTLREEIENVRLDRLRALLVESDATIIDLARRCGFGGGTHLGRLFAKRFNITMSRFRAQNRQPVSARGCSAP